MSHATMNTPYGLSWLPLAGLLLCNVPVSAAEWTFGQTPNQVVPDANPSGLLSTLTVPTFGYRVTDVDVTLNLSGTTYGGWNGDLYAWLSHDSVLSILVNRPGRTGSNPLGYPDNGFQAVTFDDEAAGDIHLYQLAWGGSPGPLTGSWQPDARSVDPAVARDDSPRPAGLAFLSVFDGRNAEGDWHLFVADANGGGEFVLDSWELRLTVEPIPEPWTASMLAGSFALAWGSMRRPIRGPGRPR